MSYTTCMGCYIWSVPEQHVLAVSRFGKFNRLVRSGFQTYNCCFETIDGVLSLMLNNFPVSVSTKTNDHTFIVIDMEIQYRRLPGDDEIFASFYKLTNPQDQMRAYVEDVIRTAVNKLTLDEVYQAKNQISDAVKDNLTGEMKSFGYEIVATPVTDLRPENAQILQAMNQVLELERGLAAQAQSNEQIANAILMEAEAQRVSLTESGKGLSAKRAAIVDGLRESVSSFSKGMNNVTPKDVLELILVTQYFDMLKDIGNSGGNTLFIKHGPSAIPDITKDIRDGFVTANQN